MSGGRSHARENRQSAPWLVKPGQQRATYKLVKVEDGFLDDLHDGSGATVRGSVEFDSANEMWATFRCLPFDGDKVTLTADRGSDGVLRVAMRGDIYDGGIREVVAGVGPDKAGTNRLTSIST
jgi:hypothetical protein